MAYKHCCVIDSQGFYVPNSYVLVTYEKGDYSDAVIHAYTLKKGEQLVEAKPPESGLVRPKWDEGQWQEGATEKEIESAEEQAAAELEASIEEIRTAKLREVGAACEATIIAGVDVNTSHGTKHFSLDQYDQTQIIGLKPQLDELVAGGDMQREVIPYHADGELCRLWTGEDFSKILTYAMNYIFYHRTYCNHLNAWIRRSESAEELLGITYGADLPSDLSKKMQVLINAAGGEA